MSANIVSLPAHKLMSDFPIGIDDAAAIAGNLAYESACFTVLQEIKPTVKGSKGGYGWPMWTGPRRREYEAYCKRNKLDPSSDETNYKWPFLELRGSEREAINALQMICNQGGGGGSSPSGGHH